MAELVPEFIVYVATKEEEGFYQRKLGLLMERVKIEVGPPPCELYELPMIYKPGKGIFEGEERVDKFIDQEIEMALGKNKK